MIRALVLCCLVAVALAEKSTCNYKGKKYLRGDSFKDDCNRCFCAGNDVVGCTAMLCIHKQEVEKDTCKHKGKLYKKGDSFKDDCNRCFCAGNDVVGCTKMLCIHEQEVEKDTCEHKGKLYKKGDSFKDDCNRCFCGGHGMVGCTKMMCIHKQASKDTCEHNGQVYKKGDRFKDDCNTCFCGGNGMIGCTKMMCRPRHGGKQTFVVEKDTCEHKGNLYKKGDKFKDDCNTCFCGGNGMVGCTRMMCKPRHGGKVMSAEAEVDAETCTVNGKVYKKGDSFKKGCNTCFCAGNNVMGCTLMKCYPGQADQQVSYADSETCTRDGKVYKKGDNFSIDGCNMCFCGGNNMIGCTKKLCPPKGCRHNGKLYAVGEHFNKECNGCICTKRGAMCTKMACRHRKPGH